MRPTALALHITLLCLLLSAVNPLVALELKSSITEYKASFKNGFPISGTATRTLEKLSDSVWRYQFNVDSLFADLNESVYFQWNGYHIIPITYQYDRSGLAVKNRTATLEFNWNKHTVRNNVQGKPWTMKIPNGAIDKLGYQLQIRLDLLIGKKTLHYQVADGGYLKQFRFELEGEEKLDTNLGRVTATRVRKIVSEKDKRQTVLWFAKEWDYLLVKLEQTESNGERYEINIENAQLGEMSNAR